jgi:hypothetical protein
MSAKMDLFHRCRIARDYLFSANEDSTGTFLVAGQEAEAVLTWDRVSKRLQNHEYASPDDFMKDMYPFKAVLLQCNSRTTKKRTKHIELVFRILDDIVSGCSELTSCTDSCGDVIDVLDGEKNAELMNAFHTSRKS